MRRHGWKIVTLALAAMVAAACSPLPPAGEAMPAGSGSTACADPRPQVCTLQYDPVCGFSGDGKSTTYSNACSACADETVSGHRPGACACPPGPFETSIRPAGG